MTIARAQMYRQLYQMGGIGTLPMDYGQSLQVNNQAQMPMPNYSSAVNITSNPLLNYGQTPLANGGGTPLTMRSGGITRLGYANGDVVNIEDQLMQQSQQPQQPAQPPLQGMEGQQPNVKDPKQALEIIIQMLIAQGIPPEQARQIALQMVQAVAEGGMGEMEDQRIEARFGGSINGREQYGLGSIFKGAAKAVSSVVSGVTNAVKSVASSPLGKAALAAAAIYAGGGGSFFGYTPFPGATASGFSLSNLPFGETLFGGRDIVDAGLTKGIFGVGGEFAPFSGTLASSLSSPRGILSNVLPFAGGLFAGSSIQQKPEYDPNLTPQQNQAKVDAWKAQLNPLLNPTIQYPNNPFYSQTQMAANGGRIGYQEGGIGDLIKQTTQQSFFGIPAMAMGGRMGYALGNEVPTRQNQAGVTELDYRDTGGFVPPIGIKEKADDIPAMLSNNEFVFTADAVRNAGDGDENLGAKRMYALMKNLENGGSV